MGVDTHNAAWSSCLGVYIAFSCLRFMATRILQTVATSIEASTCGPAQWAQLAVCALLSYALARPSRAAQAATSLAFRALTSLMVRPFFKPVAWGQAPSDWTPWLQRGAARGPGSTTSSVAGSEASSTWSGKDVASFRIPDRKLKSRARGAGLPPPPPHLRGHSRRQAVGPWTRSQQTGGYYTSPATPRALSRGESLPVCPTSPLSPKSPLTFTLGGPRARHAFRSARPPLGSDPADSAQSAGTALERGSGPQPSPFEEASSPLPQHISQQQMDQDSVLDAPSWSSQASASLTHLTAKGAALLRPLVPPTPSLSLERLKRWPSAPAAPWPFGRSTPSVASDEEEEGEAADSSRRGSLDGPNGPPAHSSRHYTRGDIAAASPARRAALERCAAAARMDCAAAAAGRALPGRVAAADGRGASALASLGLDGDCPPAIRALVPDEHLLQLGALMDEGPTAEAMAALGVAPACSERGALCGAADDFSKASWEPVASESRPGLRLAAWRLPLRKGLYAYKTLVTIDGVSPADVRPFHLDDAARALWDDGALEVRRAVPPGCARASRHAESCMHSYLSKFPGPMAPRRYTYARRVWHRPADGGCYALCTGCELPEGAFLDGKNDAPRRREVEVLEFCSGAVVRAAPGGGVQIATLYFEDSQVRPGLAKVGVPKGLWPFWTKYEAALRVFAGARASGAAAVLHHRGGSGDAGSDGEGSDDEVYGALAELKAARRASERRRGGALGASSRWARRIIVAGAIKMTHVILMAD